ncbi:CRISPR system precrRNA processing endoribonuclease RAMP protein Cas6 [Leptothoe sp. PORK10 BA2]|uniref:CRISPR system precrRNA processing endoribonuclease RAMP protein Cas6 n=1 Tax=Leptothoe sp. PORK10 BA2 TaxID=3110254 RepID=UPI002B1F6B46|nr:CRISPR system precrRNA processing endoribonuclease RAMP protein Cas6 [Leptothoe sp. PORK10 BA2]MEA5464258.1 CRISPR system precrRNA processing endoribonuclease RAMP protein Cas6 [Leptothoe sp. PORK10 BA2]
MVTTFDLHTVALGNNKTDIGCLGALTFQISAATDPLIIKRTNALTNFSGYCGVGNNTNLGMGMVRVTK